MINRWLKSLTKLNTHEKCQTNRKKGEHHLDENHLQKSANNITLNGKD